MTRMQQEFYRIITNQMIDFIEDFHREFTIERIEKIQEKKLRFLLENITVDKDKIVNKKGFLTYSKFVYYADKMIEEESEKIVSINSSKIEELLQKRDFLLYTLETHTPILSKRHQLIQDLSEKKLMFKKNGKNILDEIDYFIIEKFGFYNFFDSNKNYMIKEKINTFYKEFIQKTLHYTVQNPQLNAREMHSIDRQEF